MYYSKIRNVKSPIKGTATDAGIDFYVPEFEESFLKDLKDKNQNKKFALKDNDIILAPHESILIPSGIKVNLKKTKEHTKWGGIMLVVHNKSGIASRQQLDRLAEVIDEDYQGEVHINVVNTSEKLQNITAGSKLVQMILEETVYLQPKELPIEQLFDEESVRGEGGFGHTDKQQ